MSCNTIDPEAITRRGEGRLPGLMGLVVDHISPEASILHMKIRQDLLAPNGYLHAASVVALADTACGYGTMAGLPENAKGFTTIELKSNFTGTAREGTLSCRARAVHKGRMTQVWDAEVAHEETGKVIAHFRCTQMILFEALNTCLA